jgi:hypothetical protein
MTRSRGAASRGLLFATFCAVFVFLAVGYVVIRHRSPSSGSNTLPPLADNLSILDGHRGLLFSSAAFDATNGTVGVHRFDGSEEDRHRTGLRCERVHFAAGIGLCLSANRGAVTTFSAHVFGPDFRVRHTLPLKGIPSRARVAPDGRRGAVTVFVSGDSYNSTSFSTRTTLLDLSTGGEIADLEQFAITREEKPFKAVDFNFWGVTFAQDGERFFATLRTGGSIYLIEGNVDTRRAHVVRDDIECPSLSPDNRRIAFKKRISPSQWRLHVLDLDTLRDEALSETRSVDDQVEWLDDRSIAYMLPSQESTGGGSDVWAVNVSGAEPPRLLLRRASSPVAVKP